MNGDEACRKRPQPNAVIGGDQDGPHFGESIEAREAQPYFRQRESGLMAEVETSGHEGHILAPVTSSWVLMTAMTPV